MVEDGREAPPRVGAELPPLSRRVSQEDIDEYAEASGDRNPLHVDPEYAVAAGLPGTIAHGMLEMAMLAETVVRWAGPTARLTALSCRFSKPLLAGDTITCAGTVADADERSATVRLEALSQRGQRVLTHGRATVELAGRGRR